MPVAIVAAIKITVVKPNLVWVAPVIDLFATAVERLWICLGLVRQPDCGQRDAREAEAEFLQRSASRDRLGQALGQFIEFVIHNFPFVIRILLFALRANPETLRTACKPSHLQAASAVSRRRDAHNT